MTELIWNNNPQTIQYYVTIRFFDGKSFREELLYLLPLHEHTTGEMIFNELIHFIKEWHGCEQNCVRCYRWGSVDGWTRAW